MLLEKCRISKNIRYRKDGKLISKKEMQEILNANPEAKLVDNTKERELCPDRLEAIRQIEENFATTFIIDHTVKIEGGVFARSESGATLQLRDDSVEVNLNGVITVYELDVAESRFITELNAATLKALEEGTELESFQITGDSGKVYTYDAKTLDVISVEEPVIEEPEKPEEKLVDYVITQRRLAQAEVIKGYQAKLVA